MKDSRELEILVAKIQTQLAPDAEVLHDVKLEGRQTGAKRQIDVLVRQRIGQYEMLIAIDCKDYNRPVDVKGVEEFHGLCDDVGAHKGAIVCPKGFTASAKKRAASYQISLYSPVDTRPHKWRVTVEAPVLCDFRSAGISFRVSCDAPVPFSIPYDFYKTMIAHDQNGKQLGTPLNSAIGKWNEGRFPTEVGLHKNLPIFDTLTIHADNGYGMRIPIDVSASFNVKSQLYFGKVPITDISGFKDELDGGVITNAFTLGVLDPNEVENSWMRIANETDMPSPVVMKLQGLVAWAEQQAI